MNNPADALLFLSVGGPEKPEEVYPFLENILRASKSEIPPKRIEEVAERYFARGGKSPANEECRNMIQSLENLLKAEGPDIPVYFGNLFSEPLLTGTVRKMKNDGIANALAFATSAFGSEFSCLRYRRAIEEAREEAGEGAPVIKKLRLFFNHPDFIDAQASRLNETLASVEPGGGNIKLVFTAHSIPVDNPSTPQYVQQIRESCFLVAKGCGFRDWTLGFQSRSGPPHQPWLRPSPEEILKDAAGLGETTALIMPIGFLFDNMEIVHDLDRELAGAAAGFGIRMLRVSTAGDHPKIIRMIRKLIMERVDGRIARECVGSMEASDDDCSECLCRQPGSWTVEK